MLTYYVYLFQLIFLYDNLCILIQISMTFVDSAQVK